MDRQILNFTVNEQILTVDEPIRISTNKVNYIEAHFDLGTNWSGYDSVRAVWFNDFNCISTVLDSLGNCVVPFEVMKRKGNVKVNLVGSISEDDVLTDRLTSYPVVAVIVDCTAQITGANTSPITPSEYEQFVAAVHEDAERAEAGATASEQSAQNASASAQNASQSAQSAHDDKVAIEEAIAEVIQQIEDFEQVQVVVNTLPPTSPATSDFTDGVLTLGIPQGVKGDTGNGIQSIRKTGTSGLVDTYTITYTDGQTTTFNVTNGAKGDTGNGISSIEKTSTVGLVDTYTITYTDGTTSTFTVTNGEKGDKGDQGEVSLSELEDATVVQTLSDSEPYNYRRTNNGNGSGHREYDEIVGASVGWNQLCKMNTSPLTTQNVTFTQGENGHITASGTISSTYASFLKNVQIISGHKYLTASIVYKNPNNITFDIGSLNSAMNAPLGATKVFNSTASSNQSFGLQHVTSGVDFTGLEFAYMFTDLTLALGSTIADYVYSLEQSTAGSGVAWLKTHFPKLFDNGYMSYDSGSIKSVGGLTAHEMVGVNAWDEEWELGSYNSDGTEYPSTARIRSENYIGVIPNETYYISCTAVADIFFYDANHAHIAPYIQRRNNTFVIPTNAEYMRFCLDTSYGTTYKNDICINLSDASINGQYFPYEKHTYPLDSSVTLRGRYKLDANNQLYADGDTYESDGSVTRKYGAVDLGSLTWTYQANETRFYSADIKTLVKPSPNNAVPVNALSSIFNVVAVSYFDGNMQLCMGTTGNLFVRDAAFTDATAFKTAMNGVMLVYELATPTTDSATAYENPQWCDSHGTEEYVGSELPVGHNTDYPMTMVDCADGLSNGTYTPKLTVANGKLTFEWQSV